MDSLLKIDSIMYRVTDLENAAQFYENQLGLKRIWTDSERKMIGFALKEGDSEIVIHNDSSIPNPDFSFLVTDVVRLCEDFKKEGQQICLDPIDVRCGKFAILSDPDGNKIPIIDLTAFGGKPRYT